MALHLYIEFHLRPRELRCYQLTRLVVLGEDTPEHREVRTLRPSNTHPTKQSPKQQGEPVLPARHCYDLAHQPNLLCIYHSLRCGRIKHSPLTNRRTSPKKGQPSCKALRQGKQHLISLLLSALKASGLLNSFLKVINDAFRFC